MISCLQIINNDLQERVYNFLTGPHSILLTHNVFFTSLLFLVVRKNLFTSESLSRHSVKLAIQGLVVSVLYCTITAFVIVFWLWIQGLGFMLLLPDIVKLGIYCLYLHSLGVVLYLNTKRFALAYLTSFAFHFIAFVGYRALLIRGLYVSISLHPWLLLAAASIILHLNIMDIKKIDHIV